MIGVKQDFEDRLKEVNLYFKFLNDIHEDEASLSLPKKRLIADRTQRIDSDLTSLLKANAFLVMYNLVESTIREGILVIYRKLETEEYSYDKIRNELKSIWSKYQFRKSFDINSSWETYYKKTLEIVDDILNKSTVRLDRNAIPISGNLNADQVRILCDMHGISKNVHRAAKGGVSLEEIKTQRNLLAHGSLAFTECGRQFSIDQLNDMKHESIIFIRGILNNMESYYNNKDFEK